VGCSFGFGAGSGIGFDVGAAGVDFNLFKLEASELVNFVCGSFGSSFSFFTILDSSFTDMFKKNRQSESLYLSLVQGKITSWERDKWSSGDSYEYGDSRNL